MIDAVPRDPAPPARPHTGRRRNERARRAILDATVRLMGSDEPGSPTVDAIAAEAGVGRQTLYRWWPSKGAILLEALADAAADRVPAAATGSLARDLEAFLVATVRQVSEPRTSRMLRRLAREAAVDDHAAELLRNFTQSRRSALRELIDAHDGRASGDCDVDLYIDQVYGTIWYRLLLDHAPLDDSTALALASTLERHLASERSPSRRDGGVGSPGISTVSPDPLR